MLLRRLELTDVRSYQHEVVEFEAGVTVLVGANARGKTTVLEAAHRLATGRSHRVASDTPLVRAGTDRGTVRAVIESDVGRRRTVEVGFGGPGGTTARVDGQTARRASEAVGVLRVVLFAPEDLAIVRGDPGERRRFLDDLLAQRRPAYAAARSEYERVLRQRNRLLSSGAAAGGGAGSTLDVWTEQLVQHGAVLVAARVAAVHALAGPTADLYAQVADRPEVVDLTYRSSTGAATRAEPGATAPDPDEVRADLRAALDAGGADERRRGVTLVGPHRDDLDLELGGLPVRGYASHGQLWSLALALRLATYTVLAEVGDEPVVLLDDVFAELDDTRRERLAAACARWRQVVVTAAAERDVAVSGRVLEVTLDEDGSHVRPRRDPS